MNSLVETHTICKNSEEFIEVCLKQVLPFVDVARVYCDVASDDGTKEILERMSKENEKIKLKYYEVENPLEDLVKARNMGLKEATCDWIWILDDDEYYPTSAIEKIVKYLEITKADVAALPYCFVISGEQYVPRRSKKATDRFYRNKPGLEWKGNFMYETMHDKQGRLGIQYDEASGRQFILPCQYFHLSYFKKYSWRNIIAKSRSRYPNYKNHPQFLRRLPQEIIDELRNINLPTPQYFTSTKIPNAGL